MKRTVFAAIAIALVLTFGAVTPSFAAGVYCGGGRMCDVVVNLSLPAGGIVGSAVADRTGTVTFFNLPEGPYQIAIDATKLTKPAIVKVQAGRDAPIVSAPILPAGRRSTEGPMGTVLTNAAGAPLMFVVPPASGAPRGAKPKAVSGPAPRDANPLNTIAVTVVDDLGPSTPKP